MTALENIMVGRHVRTRTGIWGALTRNAAASARSMPSPGTRANYCATSA